MESNNKDNITIGLPNPGGALYWAESGATLPTDATSALSSAYTLLGYVTEDGITMSVAEESDEIVAWGKDKVMQPQTSYSVTATANLLETSRESVLQFIYGKDNVTIAADGSITCEDTGDPLPRGVFVCDTVRNNGGATRYERRILGDAQLTDRSGDQTYNNSDALSYPFTLTAYKFTVGGKEVYQLQYFSGTSSSDE